MPTADWTRLEPDTQTNILDVDLADGVAARLADPLWMLGRQWQMGELTGEDAASPVIAHLEAASYRLDTIRLGEDPAEPYDAARLAVEALVEHDGAEADERTRIAGGLSLLERLGEAGLTEAAGTLAEHVPLRPGLPDGVVCLAVHDAGGLPAILGVSATQRAAFDEVVAAWAAWFRPRAGRVESAAWIPDRLEYRLAMTARVAEGTVTLTADEHTGGALDWYTFARTELLAGLAAPAERTVVDVTPTVLHIAGMPALSFWEIEDPSVDPGRIEVGPLDTARMLVVEAALAVSADWFLVPLRLPVAALSRLELVRITDTFGVTTEVLAAEAVTPHPAWNLWRNGELPYLLVPPPAAGNLTAEADQRVLFVRDEDANLAWALQVVPQVQPAVELPTDPVAATLDPLAVPADLTYVPISPIDADRTPLVLVDAGGVRRLVRARLAGQRTVPTGTLIGADFTLRDEELPDEGLIVERRAELGRTPDGVLHLWSSRVKRTGARAPASGLRFDQVT